MICYPLSVNAGGGDAARRSLATRERGDATLWPRWSAMSSEAKPFIQKLYNMVHDDPTVMGWTTDGTAFQIAHVEPFVQKTLPTYFKHANLSSFVRQLNTYGFAKVDSGSWVFAHPDFQRGAPDRLGLIQRKSSHRPSNERADGGSSSLPLPDDFGDAAGDADALALPPLLGAQPLQGSGPPAAVGPAELASMRSRIERLNSDMKEARAQQSDTRASIGKIMEFLSQVYHDQRRGAAPFPASVPLVRRLTDVGASGGPFDDGEGDLTQAGSKRMRVGDAGSAAAAAARSLDAPPGVTTGHTSTSGLAAAAAAAAGAGAGAGGGVSRMPSCLLPSSSAPPLSRSSSLGAQVASALPGELRDLALQLVTDSPDLHAQTIHESYASAADGDGSAPSAADDVDAYLWDFIEASQDL